MLSRSYCLHQARVCLSLARLTDDANAKRRLEEMALSFAERIGGSELADLFSTGRHAATRLGLPLRAALVCHFYSRTVF
jgi:hypothetical protein